MLMDDARRGARRDLNQHDLSKRHHINVRGITEGSRGKDNAYVVCA